MKNLILAFIVLLLFQNGISKEKTSDPLLILKLEMLYEEQNYFKLKALFTSNEEQLTRVHKLYFNALISHVFNKQESSNKFISELLKNNQNELSDTLLHTIYRAKRMNHINLYEYAEAAKASSILIEKYKHLEDTADYSNLKNEHNVWLALSETPKQEIIKSTDTKIIMKRDKVGLMNVETVFNMDTVNFLFDTGANFSVIKRSMVEDMKMQLIKADFYVAGSTGVKVLCDLAIAKEFTMSSITVKNAVFLVLNDEDFSFPEIDYYPNGAIGFPIIEALEELHFDREGNIVVPSIPIQYTYDNLALHGLMPVIAVQYKNDTLNFNFDTGASNTTLYKPFYDKYKTDIDSRYENKDFGAGSAGGIVKYNGYVVDTITFNIANSSAAIDEINLHTELVDEKVNAIYGNFGQDYIKQFDTMVLSFKYSSVLFE